LKFLLPRFCVELEFHDFKLRLCAATSREFHMLRPFVRYIAIAGLAAAMLPTTPLSAADDALSRSVDLYQQRYQVTVGGQPDKANPYEKIVQDHGQGPASLYGLRNLRAVLPGVVYRSGANNQFRDLYKEKPRNGMNSAST
jgi:hypothetical protein